MAYTYDAIMQSQWERVQEESQGVAGLLEAARVAENSEEVHRYARRLLELDAEAAALGQRAQQYVANQQNAQEYSAQNKYGLSPQEAEIARNSFGPIKKNGRMVDMSDDDKLRSYAFNKQKYRNMIADGSYSNHQGLVTRR
jgi:hypothetical protein